MLLATGDTLEGLRRSDLFDVVVDGRGDVTVLVLQDPVGRNVRRPPLDQALHAARVALLGRAPLQEAVSAITSEAVRSHGVEIGLGVVRVSQSESRVEVLNAGMPPIACATPDRIFLHPALSPAIGRADERGHPYEVVPLIWGCTWLVGSAGLTAGSLLPQTMRDLCERLELGARGLELASQTPDALRDTLLACHPDASRFARDDATLVLVGADPHARLQSGIR